MALLELENLTKIYAQPAVKNISLSLDRGNILCLLGPSGCGKTTLLRLVGGLERPDTGQVIFDGKDVTDLPSHRRNFGLMFQDFALFPHKSVFDNVAFGPVMQNQNQAQVHRRTKEMLAFVGLTDLAQRNVGDLSGGERQRVALARSLAPRPRLLMLDEPLGSLDRALREHLLLDIRSILKKLEMTAIFVTHDQSEALAVADIIAVMHQGRLRQVDPPEDLYRYPKNLFVARFLGFKNLLTGCVTFDNGVETQLGLFYPSTVGAEPQEDVTLVLRPEGARLAGASTDPKRGATVAGRVVSRFFNGQSYRVGIVVKDEVELVFDLPNEEPPPQVGGDIELHLQPSNMVAISSRPGEKTHLG